MINNKIFVDYKNNRFINGLIGSHQKDAEIVHTNTNKNIYNIYYALNFNHCIFNLSSIDNEIVQFISEYSSQIKIFVYLDVPNYTEVELLETFKNSIYYLIPENTFDNYKSYNNTIQIKNNLINSNIFYRNNSITKDKDAVCVFLDLFESIPDQLTEKLYPKTKMKIMMYNNSGIKHAQNLGVLSEIDRSYVLNKSSYFINYQNHYIHEAAVCGCKILDINNIDINQDMDIDKEITNYENLLKEYIL